MNQKNKNAATIAKKLTTLTLITTAMACTSTRQRDEHITQNMEIQNAVIEAAKADRASTEVQAEVEKSDALKEAESRLMKTLDALKDANNTVLAKMKPEEKSECAREKDDGDDYEQ